MSQASLGLISIKDLIIHELPNATLAPGSQIVLSDVVSPLPPAVRNFFQERIKAAISLGGFQIKFQATPLSPLPGLISDQLTVQQNPFVDTSKIIAQHLFKLQKGNHSAGLLCVANCTAGRGKAFAIIKLEKEEGIRAEFGGNVGQKTFRIQVLDDLLLTQRTRVFKVAVFFDTDESWASDTQAPSQSMIASYFINDFLGCMFVRLPDVATKDFFEAAENFINREVTDPEKRAKYEGALLTELNSNSRTVTPKAFIQNHIEQADQASFMAALAKVDAPITAFQKDTALVATRIRRVQLNIEGKIQVLAPPEAIDDTVKVKTVANGQTKIEIKGKLTKVDGHR